MPHVVALTENLTIVYKHSTQTTNIHATAAFLQLSVYNKIVQAHPETYARHIAGILSKILNKGLYCSNGIPPEFDLKNPIWTK